VNNQANAQLENSAEVTTATMLLQEITKKYSGVAALSEVSLEVMPGEVHALLGENGAGKSTLMNVATGATQPDIGSIFFEGSPVSSMSPKLAAQLGIAIVHQHPAVLPDMTVEENLLTALPASVFKGDESTESICKSMLLDVGLGVHLRDRVETLTVAQKHLLEIAKALAVRPKLLVLDEPTAPLGQESVDLLFSRVRSAVAAGTSVVYITHRLAEVRELAHRVTVLRDGQLRGTVVVNEVSDDDLLAMIVGRRMSSTFPPKHELSDSDAVNFTVEGVSGDGFTEVSLAAHRGQIIGIAGVVGNGQSEFLRAIAGLEPFDGSIRLAADEMNQHSLLQNAAFMPADRHSEGLMMTLTVRENAAIAALKRFKRFFLLSGKKETDTVGETLQSLAVKAASMDATVSSLSGGNQQKVVMARALLSEPRIVIADEPTQGVDVGARLEIYKILRDVSSRGIPVVVASSDAKELEGLCDQVIVMSQGRVVETLTGDQITEERMIHAAVRSKVKSLAAETQSITVSTSTSRRRFLQGDYAPSVLLVAVMLLLGAFVFSQNARYLSEFNIFSMLTLVSALGFMALGQTIAILTGGIDLSVGPLAGFVVVVASFFINDDSSAAVIILGVLVMLVVALAVGLINGSLIRFGKFTAIAATLTTYIALQGMSFILRDTPGGYISGQVSSIVASKVGPIPVAFIVLVLVALVMEFFLRKRQWGLKLRAVGSNEESARRIGVNVNRTVVLAYAATSVFTFLGAIMLMTQIGVGDPAQGVGYTLTSITAVVLGGTSLLGGRGTFIGSLLGSVLLIQVLNATSFLGLSQMWQYVFQGLLILVAAILYSVARTRKKRADAAL
jgi:ribose transport system ATP-binding protein